MSAAPHHISEEIQDAASVWLARRDRGLSAAEQDAYLEWLYADPAHGRAILQLERVWTTLNKLEQWRPAHSAIPNPDLLAPRRPSRLHWLTTTLAAAAVIALGFYVWLPGRENAPPRREAIIHPGPEKQTLADGSVVELNHGAKIDVQFTPAERRVRLAAGEAHFTVAKNPARPFTVTAGPIAVRAVGTAFSVALARENVAVLVTEGRVQVDEVPAARGLAALPLGGLSELRAGQRAVIATPEAGVAEAPEPRAASVQVRELTPAEVERSLAWQGMRLEFVDMPLADVVADFNRYNRQKLVVADSATGRILVGGNFRADNIDAFVRLLDSGFGVSSDREGDHIVLRRAP